MENFLYPVIIFQMVTLFFNNNYSSIPLHLELDYWSMRLKNMESIYFQLKDPKVKQIDLVLEKTQSPYSQYFKNLVNNVTAGKRKIINLVKENYDRYFLFLNKFYSNSFSIIRN